MLRDRGHRVTPLGALALALVGVAVTGGVDFNGGGPPGIVAPQDISGGGPATDDGGSGGPSR